MSDWDFIHDMRNDGYSSEQIADATACGYNPWEWQVVEKEKVTSQDVSENSEVIAIFNDLVDCASSYRRLTGRYLQIWGELGELYAEIEFGIRRHKAHAQGSDGKLGNDFIEIKTISPEKKAQQVEVKRAGNFNRLLIVKIDQDYNFEAQFIERKGIFKGDAAIAQVSWKNER